MSIKYKGKTVSGGGTQFTTDDTLTMSADNVLSVDTPVKAVTQAEYDAMGDDERKGLQIIMDAGISLKDRGEVYSTEETVIGTWIDGKPLYRKVHILPDKFNIPVKRSTIVDMGEDDQIKRAEVFYIRSDNMTEVLPNVFSQIHLLNGIVDVYIWENLVSNKGIDCFGGYVICEYTKTTDKAVSE